MPVARPLPLAVLLLAAVAIVALGGGRASGADDPPVATFEFARTSTPCLTGWFTGAYMQRHDCIRGDVTLPGVADDADVVAVLKAGGQELTREDAASQG